MTVDEIFSTISNHMVKGMMLHSDFADYYFFLNLCKYGETHTRHYTAESYSHRKLHKWYITHYNKLIQAEKFDYKSVIPESWYKYMRKDVGGSTIHDAVKTGLIAWVDWERETKKLYEQMYKELMTLDEVRAALYVKELIMAVDDELCDAENYMLQKKAIDYNVSDIIAEQE